MKLDIFDPFTDFDKVKKIWNELCDSNDVSYFLSWGWIGNWIKSLPKNVNIRLLVFTKRYKPTVAFFIGESPVARDKRYKIISKLLHSRGLFLNVTGIPRYDELCLENNSMLSKGSINISLKQIMNSLPYKWNEFFMPYLEPDQYPGKWLKESIRPYRLIVEKDEISPFVDLEMVRRKNGDFLSLLSSNARYQIRRSLRLYEKEGKIRVESAADIGGALDILEELVQLHNRSWSARGRIGAFESGYYYDFNKQLIKNRFEQKEIQLLRIKRGSLTIGCLYNFLYKNKVYFYQSGLAYESDNKLKPGLVCHLKAIQLNASMGYSVYDFLHEPDRYKRTLATHERKLVTAKIQKPSFLLSIEEKLVNFAKFLRLRSKGLNGHY